MSETVLPKPIAASIGLLLASLEDARGTDRSPVSQVIHLPLATAVQLLTLRERYDELAIQGDVIVDVVVGLVRERFGGGEADGWIGDEFSGFRAGPNAGSSRFEQLAEELETIIDEKVTTPLLRVSESLAASARAAQQAANPGETDKLPVADFDHITDPQLRGRLRLLTRPQLVQLLDYERGHGARPSIISMLENRIAKLDSAS